MASSADSIVQNRKRGIISGLCKRLSLDPKAFSEDMNKDFKSLCSKILKSSQKDLENNDELLKWIAFADNFPLDIQSCFKSLTELNEDLVQKSVLSGGGLTLSEADVVVFSAIHSSVIGLSESDTAKFPHLLRWMDYIQYQEGLGELFDKIVLAKPEFQPPQPKPVAKLEAESIAKASPQGTKNANNSEAALNTKKNSDKTKDGGVNQTAVEKKKEPVKELEEKDKELCVSLLKIQVGIVRKAWKHPSADSLLVEEIDTGDAKCRQVVSGLAKYLSPDEMTNRRVVLITNVKPGKLRDVMSEGLVLCASNGDHTLVEPLIAPEGAKIGECVSFSGLEGKPEDVLNPKKKQLEKITPNLSTNEEGVATFKGIPFMTSGGTCTSSIPNASIK